MITGIGARRILRRTQEQETAQRANTPASEVAAANRRRLASPSRQAPTQVGTGQFFDALRTQGVNVPGAPTAKPQQAQPQRNLRTPRNEFETILQQSEDIAVEAQSRERRRIRDERARIAQMPGSIVGVMQEVDKHITPKFGKDVRELIKSYALARSAGQQVDPRMRQYAAEAMSILQMEGPAKLREMINQYRNAPQEFASRTTEVRFDSLANTMRRVDEALGTKQGDAEREAVKAYIYGARELNGDGRPLDIIAAEALQALRKYGVEGLERGRQSIRAARDETASTPLPLGENPFARQGASVVQARVEAGAYMGTAAEQTLADERFQHGMNDFQKWMTEGQLTGPAYRSITESIFRDSVEQAGGVEKLAEMGDGEAFFRTWMAFAPVFGNFSETVVRSVNDGKALSDIDETQRAGAVAADFVLGFIPALMTGGATVVAKGAPLLARIGAIGRIAAVDVGLDAPGFAQLIMDVDGDMSEAGKAFYESTFGQVRKLNRLLEDDASPLEKAEVATGALGALIIGIAGLGAGYRAGKYAHQGISKVFRQEQLTDIETSSIEAVADSLPEQDTAEVQAVTEALVETGVPQTVAEDVAKILVAADEKAAAKTGNKSTTQKKKEVEPEEAFSFADTEPSVAFRPREEAFDFSDPDPNVAFRPRQEVANAEVPETQAQAKPKRTLKSRVESAVEASKAQDPAPKVEPSRKIKKKEPAPVEATTEALPEDLAKASPRYSYGSKRFTVEFESDLDKALYILAGDTRSRADAKYLEWAKQATGLEEAELRQLGQKVRSAIKERAKASEEGGNLAVPKVTDAASVEEAKPKRGADRIASGLDKMFSAGGPGGTAGAGLGAFDPKFVANFTKGLADVIIGSIELGEDWVRLIRERIPEELRPILNWDTVKKALRIVQKSKGVKEADLQRAEVEATVAFATRDEAMEYAYASKAKKSPKAYADFVVALAEHDRGEAFMADGMPLTERTAKEMIVLFTENGIHWKTAMRRVITDKLRALGKTKEETKAIVETSIKRGNTALNRSQQRRFNAFKAMQEMSSESYVDNLAPGDTVYLVDVEPDFEGMSPAEIENAKMTGNFTRKVVVDEDGIPIRRSSKDGTPQKMKEVTVVRDAGNFIIYKEVPTSGVQANKVSLKVGMRDSFITYGNNKSNNTTTDYVQLGLKDISELTATVRKSMGDAATFIAEHARLMEAIIENMSKGTPASALQIEQAIDAMNLPRAFREELKDLSADALAARNKERVSYATDLVKAKIVRRSNRPYEMTRYFRRVLSFLRKNIGDDAAVAIADTTLAAVDLAKDQSTIIRTKVMNIIANTWYWAKNPVIDEIAGRWASDVTPYGREGMVAEIFRELATKAKIWGPKQSEEVAEFWAKRFPTLDYKLGAKVADMDPSTVNMKKLADETVPLIMRRFANADDQANAGLTPELQAKIEDLWRDAERTATDIEGHIDVMRGLMRGVRALILEQQARVPKKEMILDAGEDTRLIGLIEKYWPRRYSEQAAGGTRKILEAYLEHYGLGSDLATEGSGNVVDSPTPGAYSESAATARQTGARIRLDDQGNPVPVSSQSSGTNISAAKQRLREIADPTGTYRASETAIGFFNDTMTAALNIETSFHINNQFGALIQYFKKAEEGMGFAMNLADNYKAKKRKPINAGLLKSAQMNEARKQVLGVRPNTGFAGRLATALANTTASSFIALNPGVVLTIYGGGTTATVRRAGLYAWARAVRKSTLSDPVRELHSRMSTAYSTAVARIGGAHLDPIKRGALDRQRWDYENLTPQEYQARYPDGGLDPTIESAALASRTMAFDQIYNYRELLQMGDWKRATRKTLAHVQLGGYYLARKCTELTMKINWLAIYDDAVRGGMPHSQAVGVADRMFEQVFNFNVRTKPPIYNNPFTYLLVQFTQDQAASIRETFTLENLETARGDMRGSSGKGMLRAVEALAAWVTIAGVTNEIATSIFGDGRVMDLLDAVRDSAEAWQDGDDEELTVAQKVFFTVLRMGGEVGASVPIVSGAAATANVLDASAVPAAIQATMPGTMLAEMAPTANSRPAIAGPLLVGLKAGTDIAITGVNAALAGEELDEETAQEMQDDAKTFVASFLNAIGVTGSGQLVRSLEGGTAVIRSQAGDTPTFRFANREFEINTDDLPGSETFKLAQGLLAGHRIMSPQWRKENTEQSPLLWLMAQQGMKHDPDSPYYEWASKWLNDYVDSKEWRNNQGRQIRNYDWRKFFKVRGNEQ